MIVRNMIWMTAVGLIASACGGDDPPSDASKFNDISSSVTNPTGEFEADNARAVADEFSKISDVNPGGTRPQGTAPTTSVACGQGGTYSISSSGNQSGGHAIISYDDCCYVAECCINGSGDWYYSTGTGAAFAYCGSYDLSYSCYGSTTVSYTGCFGSDGKWVYVVAVAGKTFAVSGTYSNGKGKLEVTASNGTWTCNYTATGGSCTGTSSLTIEG